MSLGYILIPVISFMINANMMQTQHHYVPHRKGGGHIVFGADPVGVGVGVKCQHQCDTFLFA